MFSPAPILALVLALQADGGPPSGMNGPPAEDPLDALIRRSTAPAASPQPPLPPPPAPTIAAPPAPPASPAAGSPVPAPAPAVPPSAPGARSGEDPTVGLPAGPRPYTSLPPARRVDPGSSLYTAPLVRLPPRPQGMLDGGWVMHGADGAPLYSFQLNDPGGGREIEGAWRDLRRDWASFASGPLLSVGYDGMLVTFHFFERGRAEPTIAVLRPGRAGEWTGELTGDGAPVTVVMRRN